MIASFLVAKRTKTLRYLNTDGGRPSGVLPELPNNLLLLSIGVYGLLVSKIFIVFLASDTISALVFFPAS